MRAAGAAVCGMLVLLGTACVRESHVSAVDTLSTREAQTAMASVPSRIPMVDSGSVAAARQVNDSGSPPLTCAPDSFGPGDTLTLQMRVPHGDYLTVTPPNGPTYFIVYPQWGNPRRRFSLIPSDEFKLVATLKLPADVRGIVRVVDRDTVLDPVFTAPGKYLLRMGENFEGDYSNVTYSCFLNFTQNSK